MAQKSQKNFELDYTFLLEVSIVKGNVLTFTDDKAKRYEIDKRLGRIAATATAAYRKITGGAKKQLDKNVKKIHLFDDQVKSWQNIEKHNPTAENRLAKVFPSRCPPC